MKFLTKGYEVQVWLDGLDFTIMVWKNRHDQNMKRAYWDRTGADRMPMFDFTNQMGNKKEKAYEISANALEHDLKKGLLVAIFVFTTEGSEKRYEDIFDLSWKLK
jgi:hypothetical protein